MRETAIASCLDDPKGRAANASAVASIADEIRSRGILRLERAMSSAPPAEA